MDIIKFGWDSYYAVDEVTDDMIVMLRTLKRAKEYSGVFQLSDKKNIEVVLDAPFVKDEDVPE
jgi:hypothetical protein